MIKRRAKRSATRRSANDRGCVRTASLRFTRDPGDRDTPSGAFWNIQCVQRGQALVCSLRRPKARYPRVKAVRRRSRAHQTHRLHRFGNAEHLHHSLEVVSQHVQAHLGANMLESSSEEVRRSSTCRRRVRRCVVATSSPRACGRAGAASSPALPRAPTCGCADTGRSCTVL